MDVSNAFLNGDLSEDIYMLLLPGNRDLKGNKFLIMLFADDILLTGNNFAFLDVAKHLQSSSFQIKNLSNLRYFLGLKIARSKQDIHICQRKYMLELLEDFGFLACNSVASPMDLKDKLSSDSGDLLIDVTHYRKLIGKLIYLSVTRPDISYVVQKLNQFMSKPRSDHLTHAHRVLRYLKGVSTQGLFYPADSSVRLSGYKNVDWAVCPDSRRSVIGFCIFIGNSLISCKSNKQQVMSRSNTESEYRAMAQTSSELTWIAGFLRDLHIRFPMPITLYCDNQSALHIDNNLVFHERTKHIEINYHFVCGKLISGFLKVLHVVSKDQVADVFTKPLVGKVSDVC
ncbi:PREDICTED: uncharacterized protein LOC109116040 [Tarenaya hassleriana]|uniref:uncharacterized protein LOC109116040 n=1 Tax=Tarenaya hassleriana TaxID=28532 RepID=UPI0008FD36FB|nr:PREDICTED: uncharacterized protein LOC109116040 [Tarenaya hassleriana]